MTSEKLQKLQLRREKEIRKWEKEKARPKRNYYFVYLVLIITLIYSVDEIASQIGAEVVQVIGTKIVFFRVSDNEKNRKIDLKKIK